jgi:hypothetical protein
MRQALTNRPSWLACRLAILSFWTNNSQLPERWAVLQWSWRSSVSGNRRHLHVWWSVAFFPQGYATCMTRRLLLSQNGTGGPKVKHNIAQQWLQSTVQEWAKKQKKKVTWSHYFKKDLSRENDFGQHWCKNGLSATMISDYISSTIIYVFSGVKNASEMSVYSKKCTFPAFLNYGTKTCRRECNSLRIRAG